MISKIYSKAFETIAKKPVKLWGFSLLNVLLITVASILVGPVPLLSLAISILLEVGMAMIYLRGYNGEEFCFEQMFDCFIDWETIKRVLGGMGLSLLWIFLWALIPVVGIYFSIKKTYEYRFVQYILMKEPNVGIKQSLELSKSRTYGHKKDMFFADILWIILVFVAVAVLVPLCSIQYIGWIFSICLLVVLLIAALLGQLFAGLVQAAFYIEICGDANNCNKKDTSKRHCDNCGAPMNDNDSFCASCGAKDGKKITNKNTSKK